MRKTVFGLAGIELQNLSEPMRLYSRWLRQEHLTSARQDQSSTYEESVTIDSQEKQLQALMKADETQRNRLKATLQVGQNLPQIIKSELDLHSVLQANNLTLPSSRGPVSDKYSFQAARQYLRQMVHKAPDMKIIEVGSSMGTMTEALLPAFMATPENGSDIDHAGYDQICYTNVDQALLAAAESRLKTLPNINFEILDIGRSPKEQGFEPETYDILFASHLLEREPRTHQILKHVLSLMKPGGKLLLSENTNNLCRVNFVNGLLPEWWKPGPTPTEISAPCLSLQDWNSRLADTGFSGTEVVFRDHDDERCHETSIIVSSKLRSVPDVSPNSTAKLLIESKDAEVQDISTRLGTCGIDISGIVYLEDLVQGSSLQDTIFVSLLELNQPFIRDCTPSGFSQLQHLFKNAKGIVWLTQCGDKVDPAFAIIDGLAKSARLEDPKLTLVTVALELQEGLGISDRQLSYISKILKATSFEINSNLNDMTYKEINGSMCIGRLRYDQALDPIAQNWQGPAQEEITSFDRSTPLKLEVESLTHNEPAVLQQESTESRLTLPNLLDIDVHAYDFSSKSPSSLSKESVLGFAGVVKRVGATCEGFEPGERVCGIGNLVFSSLIQVDYRCCAKIPDSLTFADAALIPQAFLTAYFVFQLASIDENDALLVQRAASVLGQAVIQIAIQRGLKSILGTVGSAEERALLEMECHIPSTDLYSDILFLTSNKWAARKDFENLSTSNINVIVNALPSVSLESSFECVDFFGRVVDITGQQSRGDSVHLRKAQSKGVSFSSFDLSQWIQHRPKYLQKGLKHVMELFSSQRVSPLRGIRKAYLSDIHQILSRPERDQELDRIVIEMRIEQPLKIIRAPKHGHRLNAETTYVIAGGLGGIGRSIAQWMVGEGAQNLVLLSRSGLETAGAPAFFESLTSRGAIVKTPPCDISSLESVRSVLADLEGLLPPIRGFIHAAVAFRDDTFYQMSHYDWKMVTKAKVQGAWNLHRTLPRDLDFFVMLFSIVSIGGNFGQSNYGAGNAYLDAMVAYRNSRGQKAAAINFGPFRSTGYIAKNKYALDATLRLGYFGEVSEPQLFALLGHYCDPTSTTLNPALNQAIVGFTKPQATILKRYREGGTALSVAVMRHFLHSHGSGPAEDQAVAAPSTSPKGTSSARHDFIAAETSTDAAAVVAAAFAAKLAVNVATQGPIDHQLPIHSYGIDSITSSTLRGWIAAEFAAEVSVFEITGGGSVADLARTIALNSPLRGR